jgi:hypothetical protein
VVQNAPHLPLSQTRAVAAMTPSNTPKQAFTNGHHPIGFMAAFPEELAQKQSPGG